MFIKRLFYISLFTLCVNNLLLAQYLDRTIYQEKTETITQLIDSKSTGKKIAALLFLDYRLYIDPKVQDNIMDSSFNCKSAFNRKTYINAQTYDTLNPFDVHDKKNYPYIYYKVNDSLLRQFFRYQLSKTLNTYLRSGLNFYSPSNQDSLFLTMKLSEIKTIFKDSLIKDFKIDNDFYSFLSKSYSDMVVILDASVYNNKHSFPKSFNTASIFRLFIIDLKTKKIVFYNYKTAYDHIDYSNFGIVYGYLPDRFKRLVHSTKSFIKLNKSYFKR